jgi:Ras-related protein Rab-7A
MPSSIGADFITKEVETDEGKKVMMQIWDTAGQERFQSLGVAYYRGADACVLVYDVNNFLSFQHLGKRKSLLGMTFLFELLTLCLIERWREDFLKQSSLPAEEAKNFPLIIIGNKIDIDDRVVSRRQARAWAEVHSSDKMQIPCFEASAKNGDNVEKAFAQIAKMVKVPQMELDMNESNSFSLTSDRSSVKRSRCC